MIRFLLSALALLSFAPSPAAAADPYPPPPKAGAPAPFKVPRSESYRLANGLEVTLIPFGIVPKAFVSLQVAAGNLNEGDQVWLSTLTGQMLREGAAGRS